MRTKIRQRTAGLLVGTSEIWSGTSNRSVVVPFGKVKAMWNGGFGAGSSSCGFGVAATRPASKIGAASVTRYMTRQSNERLQNE